MLDLQGGLTLVLRPATDEDLDAIRAWRNHPTVRRLSIVTDEITPEGHREWWRRTSADPGAWVLIFEYGGRAAGAVIFKDHDPVDGSAEWGFFLDSEGLKRTGDLFAAWVALEREAIDHGFRVLGLSRMGGRPLASNSSVLKLHRRSGFREVPERRYVVEIDGRPQEVVWTELRADQLAG
jgi:UDP-4-amino-4,6-dideoxy-N-acetyl-beta-L-altrosamine N-acetyltransferase